MSRNQILFIIGGIALVAVLYFFGNTIAPKNNSPLAEASGKEKAASEIDFLSLVDSAKTDFAESQLENLKKLETELSHTSDKKIKSEILKKLIERWDNYQLTEIAAHYNFQLAEMESNEENWAAAANKFVYASNLVKDTLLKNYLHNKAILAYQKAVEINPDNPENKINLAACFVSENGANTMQGVTLLLEVVKKDSNNVRGNFLLGKLAMTSGQYEKAIKRLEKVVSLSPENVEAYLNLAEANENLGNNKRAIEIFQKCKLLVSNPDFQREIDDYINKLKNKTN